MDERAQVEFSPSRRTLQTVDRFTCAAYGSEPMTDLDLEDAIRHFLSQVDPATGYIG